MLSWASIKWGCLSFFESSNHGVVNGVGQHIGVVNQSMINCRINHLLKFTRIRVKGELLRQWHILLLDDLSTPIQTERFQTKLPIILHSLFHSLLLFFFEIGFCHAMTLSVSSSELSMLITLMVPPGVPKDVLMPKANLETQRANTQFRCQGVPVDLTY